MSNTDATNESATAPAAATPVVDMKLEVVVLPVTDVDRAKEFYEMLGWRLDADIAAGDDLRVVQFTPPGSAGSIQFGTNVTSAEPGSARSMYLVVSDIESARDELVARGVEVSEVFHEGTPGARFNDDGRISGPAPDRSTYGSFATFSDPDGNVWLLQEITTRLPGRVTPIDVATLAQLLHETSGQHGRFEAATPPHNWWDWYAPYLSAREQGSTPDEADAAADLYMKETRGVVPR
jgi:predicted enzyme related to lactoylglutathione lyase